MQPCSFALYQLWSANLGWLVTCLTLSQHMSDSSFCDVTAGRKMAELRVGRCFATLLKRRFLTFGNRKSSENGCEFIFLLIGPMVLHGAGIAQWLERRTRDRKVAGSNPCWSGGRIFFSRVNFLCWLLFRYPFHPRVTAAARKRSRSFCQKRRWQVTAKHTYTLSMWLCMKWHGAWLYGVHRTRRDGSSFLWHQPCEHCKYTTSVDIQKTRYKKSYSLM